MLQASSWSSPTASKTGNAGRSTWTLRELSAQAAPTRCEHAGDLQAAILSHLESTAKGENIGAGGPRPEHEADDKSSFKRLSRWIKK
jgi:hypothetical protein